MSRPRLTKRELSVVRDAVEMVLAGELPDGWDGDALVAASEKLAEIASNMEVRESRRKAKS